LVGGFGRRVGRGLVPRGFLVGVVLFRRLFVFVGARRLRRRLFGLRLAGGGDVGRVLGWTFAREHVGADGAAPEEHDDQAEKREEDAPLAVLPAGGDRQRGLRLVELSRCERRHLSRRRELRHPRRVGIGLPERRVVVERRGRELRIGATQIPRRR